VLSWKSLALRLRIVAIPNERTLHVGAVPRGGGIVVASVWLALLALLFSNDQVAQGDFLALFVGGAVVAILGIVDDVVDLKASLKLLVQIVAVIWGLSWVGGMPDFVLPFAPEDLEWLGFLFGTLALLWAISLYNFMDGIDGMAGSGAVFMSVTMGTFLWLQGNTPFAALCFLLAAACAGFVWFNWPPAKLFMGDAGSGFLGYVFGLLMLASVREEPTLLWVWLVIMGYFLTDTTTTLLLRMIFVKPFYGTHRFHAYQSLARRTGNHLKVTSGVLLVQVLWLLPLAILAFRFPEYGPWVFLVAVAPLVVFCATQGTLREL
jgi:Fuc2NAc and GlcNAc transferase